MLQTVLKTFAALSVDELYAVLQLRSAVFVVEQTCVYQDMDGLDPQCLHLLIADQTGVLAYCRLLPPGLKYPEWSIGRVITAPSARGRGLGHDLIRDGLVEIVRRGGSAVRISAQAHLEGFYEGHGFKSVGAPYLEDDIPHVEMLHSGAASSSL